MTDEDTQSKIHRVFGVFRAPETAALWMILVLLGFFGIWSWIEGKEKNAEKRLPQIDLVQVDSQEQQWQLDFIAASPRYVAIYYCARDGKPQLLFPAFGTPPGLTWPLPAQEKHRLPNDKDLLQIPNQKPGNLFVISSTFGTPNLPFELWESVPVDNKGKLKGLSYEIIAVNQRKKP